MYSYWVANVVRLEMRPDLVRSTVKRYLSAKLGTRKVTVKVSLDESFILMLIKSFAYSVEGVMVEVVDEEFFGLVVLLVK